ncbi:MAG: MurR/RpiR family transcriptional regulator [Holophaga sp.]|nr:MurR/RpiR family transcriptional regulator [Holophaga sp.]
MTSPLPIPEIETRLLQAYSELPPGQRSVVDCLTADPLLGAMWGIEAMAERAEVSVGTVLRLAKRLGYHSFIEFRDALRSAFSMRTVENAAEANAPLRDIHGTLAEVTRRDGLCFQRLMQDVDEPLLAEATRMLVQAHHRVILGRGVSHMMCLILAFYLTQAGLPCVAAIPSDYATQVANLGPGDLLVAISFPPYSRETVDAMAFARENGVQILAFSDRKDSPLALHSDLLIPVPSEDLLYSHSLTTFAALSHAFAIVVAGLDAWGWENNIYKFILPILAILFRLF